MAYGKILVDTITYDDNGTDVDVTVQSLANAASNPSSGSYDFVASGAIANGDTVIVNANGTVSVVGQTGSSNPSVGTPVVFESASIVYTASAYDSTNNKVVVAYRDAANYNYGTAVVGTVSGDSISFGTPVVFESDSITLRQITYDSTNEKIVIAYEDVGNSQYGTAIVGTVSGDSISFGTPTVFNAASTNGATCGMAYDSTNQKVVIGYRDGGNLNYGTAVVGTVSGTSISFGTPAVFESGNSYDISPIFDSTNDKVVIAYRDNGNSYYGTAVVGTVSGTSISFGSPVVFESAATYDMTAVYDSTNNKVVIAYRDNGNSNYGTAIVGTVSGTNISFGTAVVFNSAGSYYNSTVYDSTNQKVVINYKDGGNLNYGTAIIGTVSGTSISFGTAVVFESANSIYISAIYDSTNQKVVIAYADSGNSNYGTSVVLSPTSFVTNLTAVNYIGIAAEAISDTATGKINIIGGVNEGQTGLTAGQTYYVQGDGSLGLSPAVPSVVAGTAISSTKLIVKG